MKYLYLICFLLLFADIAYARPMGEGKYTASLETFGAWTIMRLNWATVNLSNSVDYAGNESIDIGVRSGRWLTLAYFAGREYNYNRSMHNYLVHNRGSPGSEIRWASQNYGRARRYSGGGDKGKSDISIGQFTAADPADIVRVKYYKTGGKEMVSQSGMSDNTTMRIIGIWLGD